MKKEVWDKKKLLEVLNANENQSKAAYELGFTRQWMNKLIAKYGIKYKIEFVIVNKTYTQKYKKRKYIFY